MIKYYIGTSGWHYDHRLEPFLSSLPSSYIYFNNDMEGFAVKNAKRLDELLQ